MESNSVKLFLLVMSWILLHWWLLLLLLLLLLQLRIIRVYAGILASLLNDFQDFFVLFLMLILVYLLWNCLNNLLQFINIFKRRVTTKKTTTSGYIPCFLSRLQPCAVFFNCIFLTHIFFFFLQLESWNLVL